MSGTGLALDWVIKTDIVVVAVLYVLIGTTGSVDWHWVIKTTGIGDSTLSTLMTLLTVWTLTLD